MFKVTRDKRIWDLKVSHLGRDYDILGLFNYDLDTAETMYIPWADLMRRVFEVDVLLCPHCLGKRRIVAFLDDPLVIHRILRHVGLDPEPRPPPLPSQLEMF